MRVSISPPVRERRSRLSRKSLRVSRLSARSRPSRISRVPNDFQDDEPAKFSRAQVGLCFVCLAVFLIVVALGAIYLLHRDSASNNDFTSPGTLACQNYGAKRNAKTTGTNKTAARPIH